MALMRMRIGRTLSIVRRMYCGSVELLFAAGVGNIKKRELGPLFNYNNPSVAHSLSP